MNSTSCKRDTYELGGTFGIHNIGFEFGLSAEAQGQTAATSSNAEADGPLPVIGLHGVWRINDKFYLDAGIQYFQISFDPYDGSITDFTLSGVWQFSEHWGIGAGWNQFRTNLEVDGDRFDGELTLEIRRRARLRDRFVLRDVTARPPASDRNCSMTPVGIPPASATLIDDMPLSRIVSSLPGARRTAARSDRACTRRGQLELTDQWPEAGAGKRRCARA